VLNKLRYSLALACSVVLLGCSQSPEPAVESSAVESSGAEASATAADNSVGIFECDDYLAKYEACLATKVPEAARATLTQSLDQTRAAWRSAAGNPGATEVLASTCTQARAALKQTLAAYGCTDF
jgi:hypothetical protein